YSLSGELDNMKYGDPNLISYRSNAGGNAELILLKVDKISKIISGTFSGTLYSDEGDLVEITEGRFDLTY
ncbi:MAG: hypothetical protein OEW67_15030, partial [Cyclobacteriaceae bacterium]|nr:hypothetical protein [Cyclobacteriaceae bacterium]